MNFSFFCEEPRMQTIFKDYFSICFILMLLFIICSLITTTVSLGEDVKNALLQETVGKDGSYKYWLLISILVSAPALLSLLMDLLPPRSTATRKLHQYSLICRSVVLLSIIIPNTILLIMNYLSYDVVVIFQIQNSTFYAQFYLIVGVMFCTMLGAKNEDSSTKDFLPMGERYVKRFLATLFVSRFLLVLATVLSGDGTVTLSLSIAAAVCFAAGLLQMLFIAWKALYGLWRQSTCLKFQKYNQMHDFYRILATACYGVFTFILYCQSNQVVSPEAVYDDAPDFFVTYLMGVTVFIILLNVIEERCYLREVELKEEQLQTRLNLMRYISHEMRSPLNSVFMGLQLLHNGITGTIVSTRRSITMLRKDTRLVSEKQFKDRKEKLQAAFTSVASTMKDLLETCDMVKESANVALENLNDMLTFDKIDENKLLLEVEDLNVWTFTSETTKPFNINAIKAQVSLTIECAEMDLDWMQRCIIKADKFKLNQVLRNFLSNALKFCSPSNGEVKVLVERRAVTGRVARPISSPSADPIPISHVARVSVTDNGCGISEENQKKLFGKHVQFNAGILQKGGGSGLGLWISKSLVELHGGIVGAVSHEGKGSTFFFELPLFKTPSLDREGILEDTNADDVMKISRTETELEVNHLSEIPLALISDVETGHGLKNHSSEVDNARQSSLAKSYWPQSLRRFLLPKRSSAVYSSSPVEPPSPTNNGPKQTKLLGSPLDMQTGRSFDTGVSVGSGSSGSPFAPNGLQIAVGSSAERRRKLLMNRYDGGALTAAPVIDFKDDEEEEESDDDDKAERSSVDKAERSSIRSSFTKRAFRFMIVDDTIATRKLMRRMLTSAGHYVDDAVDGLAFLRKMGVSVDSKMKPTESNHKISTTYDIVLMDDNMPNLSGPEATAAIRAAGYTGLIFGVTGNTFDDQIADFKSKGADMVFTKPLNMKELHEAIKLKLPGAL